MSYIQNASQEIGFAMVTTAGAADAAATVAARRILDGVGFTSCIGNIINRGAGGYSLIADSSDVNGRTVSLFFTASGDVPIMYTFATQPGVVLTQGSNINATFNGSILGSLLGNVQGGVGGNVLGSVQGNIGGNVLGNLNGSVAGNVTGSVGSVAGNVGGNVVGSVGSVAGNVNGDVLGSVRGNVGGSVLLNVVGNVNGSVGSIAVGGILATSFTTAALNAIADAMLDRNMATGVDSGSNSVRTVRQALRTSRNKVDTVNGIVYKEDDTTTSYTFSITTAAGNPITVFDPSDV